MAPCEEDNRLDYKSKHIADELAGSQCHNRGPGDEPHVHAWLINGRAKATEVYPEALVSSILRGFRRNLQDEGKMSVSLLEPGLLVMMSWISLKRR